MSLPTFSASMAIVTRLREAASEKDYKNKWLSAKEWAARINQQPQQPKQPTVTGSELNRAVSVHSGGVIDSLDTTVNRTGIFRHRSCCPGDYNYYYLLSDDRHIPERKGIEPTVSPVAARLQEQPAAAKKPCNTSTTTTSPQGQAKVDLVATSPQEPSALATKPCPQATASPRQRKKRALPLATNPQGSPAKKPCPNNAVSPPLATQANALNLLTELVESVVAESSSSKEPGSAPNKKTSSKPEGRMPSSLPVRKKRGQHMTRGARRDAERDAKRDAERDAKRDAERDAKRDAERDAERDAKRDAERDAKRDAERDAKRDVQRDCVRDAARDKAKDVATKSKAEDVEHLPWQQIKTVVQSNWGSVTSRAKKIEMQLKQLSHCDILTAATILGVLLNRRSFEFVRSRFEQSFEHKFLDDDPKSVVNATNGAIVGNVKAFIAHHTGGGRRKKDVQDALDAVVVAASFQTGPSNFAISRALSVSNEKVGDCRNWAATLRRDKVPFKPHVLKKRSDCYRHIAIKAVREFCHSDEGGREDPSSARVFNVPDPEYPNDESKVSVCSARLFLDSTLDAKHERFLNSSVYRKFQDENDNKTIAREIFRLSVCPCMRTPQDDKKNRKPAVEPGPPASCEAEWSDTQF